MKIGSEDLMTDPLKRKTPPSGLKTPSIKENTSISRYFERQQQWSKITGIGFQAGPVSAWTFSWLNIAVQIFSRVFM
jgi:hypothetical protein